jgi:hypothetical protein
MELARPPGWSRQNDWNPQRRNMWTVRPEAGSVDLETAFENCTGGSSLTLPRRCETLVAWFGTRPARTLDFAT